MRKIYFLITQYILTILRIFYVWLGGGQECLICGHITYLYPVCKSCRKKHFNIKKIFSIERCKYCGRELISSFETCTTCREKRTVFSADKMFPLFSYRLWNKQLLFRWKILGERSISAFYASVVEKVLHEFQIKNIVPVPPRKGKIQKNGWDQIDELCNFLEFKYGFFRFNLLERNSTVQQKKLNRAERLETIKSAYSLVDFKGTVPEKVCLVDDVCTTGSTIECCSNLLKAAGVKEVYVITLYIVD